MEVSFASQDGLGQLCVYIGESLGNKRVWIIEKGRRERQKTNTKYFHNDGNFLKVKVKAS